MVLCVGRRSFRLLRFVLIAMGLAKFRLILANLPSGRFDMRYKNRLNQRNLRVIWFVVANRNTIKMISLDC